MSPTYKISDKGEQVIRLGNAVTEERLGNDTEELHIPRDPSNRHFAQFCADVKRLGADVVEGEDKEHPGYQELRAAAYPSVVDQMDTMYHLGAAEWKKAIKKIKDKYPDSIVARTTIEPLPQWCLDLDIEEES